MQPGDTAAPPPDDSPVVRLPIYRALATVVVGFLPGLYAVDLWVGHLDRGQIEADEGEGFYLPDEQLGWVPRPHFENPDFETQLDSRGMRNPEIPDDPSPTEVRLVGMGASRVYGADGVHQPEIWNYLLEEALERQSPGVRVLNGGVMAYSTVQSCRRAIALLDELQPDLLFVMMSPGAQLMLDPSAARGWVRVEGELVRSDVLEGWPAFAHPTVARAHQLLLGSNLYRRNSAKIDLENADRDENIQRWVLCREETSPAVEAMLQRTSEELVALADAARAVSCELRLLLIPEHYMDGDGRWRVYCRSHRASGAPAPGTPRSEPIAVLEERCRALGLTCWNFEAENEIIGANRQLYRSQDDRHWSAAGHRLIAEGLRRRLAAEGLLDALRSRRAANPRH